MLLQRHQCFNDQKIFSADLAKYPALLQFPRRWRYVNLQTAHIFQQHLPAFWPDAFNVSRELVFLTFARFLRCPPIADHVIHREYAG